MGVFDRDGDGKTTIGEAAYTLEQIEEYERAWEGTPGKDDPASCGGVALGCVGCVAIPIGVLGLVLWIAWIAFG